MADQKSASIQARENTGQFQAINPEASLGDAQHHIERIAVTALAANDYLEIVNDPCYFYDFAERMERNKLQYLGDAQLSVMVDQDLPPEVQNTLRNVSSNLVRREQYLDFLRNRMFRRTLMCHQGVQLTRRIDGESIEKMWVSGRLKPESSTLNDITTEREKFMHVSGGAIQTSDVMSKAAFLYLNSVWPKSIRYTELLELARATAASARPDNRAAPPQHLAANLVKCFMGELLDFTVSPPHFCSEISAQSARSAFA